MKNKTTVTETSPHAAHGIEPDIDGTYDSHVIDLLDVDPMKHKVASEHALRDITEEWYWKGYNDALDKVNALLKGTLEDS